MGKLAFFILFLFSSRLWGALPSHEPFSSILSKVVIDKGVDYPKLVEMAPALEGYIATLGAVHHSTLEQSSEDEQMAFWLNAYNACMLHRVVSHYPIKKAGGLLGIENKLKGRPHNSVWQIPQVFKEQHCFVAGTKRSQDDMEHGIIRKMGDPRIHFALNCAAISCPSLMGTAYIPLHLQTQLNQRVQLFLNTPKHFLIKKEGKRRLIFLNKVMDWFKEDFGGILGLKKFFSGYLQGKEKKVLQDFQTKVTFFNYNWTLNDGSL